MTSDAIALQTLFWTQAAAIGQIVGALATAAAVIVSLWIVLSERREKLRFVVGHRVIIGPGHPRQDVVAFVVTNDGFRSARIQSFGWRTGWLPWGPKWLRYRFAIQTADAVAGSQNPPLTLEPGETASMLILRSSLIEHIPAWDDMLELRRVPLLGRRLPPVFGLAHTTRGTYRVRVERSLTRYLEDQRRSRHEETTQA